MTLVITFDPEGIQPYGSRVLGVKRNGKVPIVGDSPHPLATLAYTIIFDSEPGGATETRRYVFHLSTSDAAGSDSILIQRVKLATAGIMVSIHKRA